MGVRSAPIRNAGTPPPVASPVAPEGLMPIGPAGLVSQLEGARSTKLDPVILVWVRRSLHRGGCQSYQAHERGNNHPHLSPPSRFQRRDADEWLRKMARSAASPPCGSPVCARLFSWIELMRNIGSLLIESLRADPSERVRCGQAASLASETTQTEPAAGTRPCSARAKVNISNPRSHKREKSYRDQLRPTTFQRHDRRS
jgi:hypothetical protein